MQFYGFVDDIIGPQRWWTSLGESLALDVFEFNDKAIPNFYFIFDLPFHISKISVKYLSHFLNISWVPEQNFKFIQIFPKIPKVLSDLGLDTTIY